MKPRDSIRLHALTLAMAGMLGLSPAHADKPDWAGGGKGAKHERESGHKEDRREAAREREHHFNDEHRREVREYFAGEWKGGRCPPGLAKKHNGCMPPGQARKWRLGRPLPRDVVFYDVPQPLVVKIGLPPPGYRYVRVAGDILLIATGTAMVVDAIQDLGR